MSDAILLKMVGKALYGRESDWMQRLQVALDIDDETMAGWISGKPLSHSELEALCQLFEQHMDDDVDVFHALEDRCMEAEHSVTMATIR